jgi:hypothetical protein
MYWLPAIFIFIEMLFIYHVDKLISYVNSLALYKKYKDKELLSYIEKEHKNSLIIYQTIGILLLLEVVYFIIGLFFTFWIVSIVFLFYFIILLLMDKFQSISNAKMIKLANLKNFTTSDIKFERFLKLNTINQSDMLIHKLKTYSYPLLKIIAFISIIIIHYNPSPINLGNNRIGFYTDTTTLVNDKKESIGKYAYTINVVELDKYTNGMSKIKLINVEITHGFDPDKYDWVKTSVVNKFSSLKKENEIEWLESKNNKTKTK